MTTETLRRTVAAAALGLKGTVWPNGLGFDARGWEFLLHDDDTWSATYRGQREVPRYARDRSLVRAKALALGLVRNHLGAR